MAIIDGNEILFSSNINICDKLRQEKTVEITQNGPTEITADEGYELSKVTANVHVKAPTQEKAVDITENGTTEIVADEGYALSKVTANVNVKGSNKLASLVDRSITEITAEDLKGLTEIGVSAFSNLKNPFKITIPESIKYFDDSCFSRIDLIHIYFEGNNFDSSNPFGVSIFNCCHQVHFHFKNVSDMGAFFEKNSVMTSNAPFSGTDMNYLYLGDSLIENLDVPENITQIGYSIFRNNRVLKNIRFLGDVTALGTYLFYGCDKLDTVEFPNNTVVPTLGNTQGLFNVRTLKVPQSLYDEWVTATNWSTIANRIVAI